ncbi:hypothetical protein DFH07DRAFT_1025222, partial [Mycena maculata]
AIILRRQSKTEIQINSGATLYTSIFARRTSIRLLMSTPLQKPLLLPGIAPHLFQSRRDKTSKKSSQATMSHPREPSDSSMNSDYAARRTAKSKVESQAAHIALLEAQLVSMNQLAETTAKLNANTQQQLSTAIFHLTTITVLVPTTGGDGALEGAITAARGFLQAVVDGGHA